MKRVWNKFFNRISLAEMLFLIMLVACIVLSIFAAGTSYSVTRTNADLKPIEIKPDQILEQDGSADFYFSDLEWKNGFNSLMFYGSHQDISVYADEALIYRRAIVNSPFGHTTGSTWNFVTIPSDSKEVRIHTVQAYEGPTHLNMQFMMGNGYDMVLSKMYESMMGGIVCLFIILIGICLMVYWILTIEFANELREILYLGLFAILLGLWAFGETDIAQILIYNRVFGSYMAFTCLFLLGPVSVLFAHYYMRLKDKYVYRILTLYGVTVGVITIMLQAHGVRDFKQLDMLIQSVLPLSFLYWIVGIIACIRKKREIRRAVANLIGMGIIGVAVAIDMVAYYTDRSSANRSGKFGFLLYVILLGVMTARSTKERLADARQLDMYRELATKDMLTNCYNRNAYDTDWKELKDPTDWVVVALDLNCLKECNDTLGHAAGDEYLLGTAKSIRQVFERYGKCYRIGGDEFVVLLKKPARADVGDLVLKVTNRVQISVRDLPIKELGVAAGYEFYDPKKDQNLEDTRIRADQKLYNNKKSMKEKLSVG